MRIGMVPDVVRGRPPSAVIRLAAQDRERAVELPRAARPARAGAAASPFPSREHGRPRPAARAPAPAGRRSRTPCAAAPLLALAHEVGELLGRAACRSRRARRARSPRRAARCGALAHHRPRAIARTGRLLRSSRTVELAVAREPALVFGRRHRRAGRSPCRRRSSVGSPAARLRRARRLDSRFEHQPREPSWTTSRESVTSTSTSRPRSWPACTRTSPTSATPTTSSRHVRARRPRGRRRRGAGGRGHARQPLAALHARADRRDGGQLLQVVDPRGYQRAARVRPATRSARASSPCQPGDARRAGRTGSRHEPRQLTATLARVRARRSAIGRPRQPRGPRGGAGRCRRRRRRRDLVPR